MSRTLLAVLLGFCCAWVFTPASAHALSIPGVKDKKKEEEEKKKKEEEQKKKDEAAAAKTADQPAAQNEKKTETAAAPKAEETPAPAPAQGAVTTSEMTLTKEGWEEYKKNKVGAFVEYEMPAQAGAKMRYEVVEVGENFVTILNTTSMPQYKQQSKTKFIFKGDTTEKVTAANKEFTATKTEMSTDGKVTMKSWSSKEIPQLMGGLIKSESPAGTVNMVLSAYGEGK